MGQTLFGCFHAFVPLDSVLNPARRHVNIATAVHEITQERSATMGHGINLAHTHRDLVPRTFEDRYPRFDGRGGGGRDASPAFAPPATHSALDRGHTHGSEATCHHIAALPHLLPLQHLYVLGDDGTEQFTATMVGYPPEFFESDVVIQCVVCLATSFLGRRVYRSKLQTPEATHDRFPPHTGLPLQSIQYLALLLLGGGKICVQLNPAQFFLCLHSHIPTTLTGIVIYTLLLY